MLTIEIHVATQFLKLFHNFFLFSLFIVINSLNDTEASHSGFSVTPSNTVEEMSFLISGLDSKTSFNLVLDK